MQDNQPPEIFSAARRKALRLRMLKLQSRPGAPRYLLADKVEDVLDRLSFLRHVPQNSLIIGDHSGELAQNLPGQIVSMEPASGFNEEAPFPARGFDFIASLGTLDTVNDLPGALIHLRAALAPGGLMIASFNGAGSLPSLREAMRVADGDRPAPRIHPQVDVRAGGQLLQRSGFSNPVVDSRSLQVRFRSLDGLVADLRAQGLTNVLMRGGPPLLKAASERARVAFGGPVVESFEILTLSGWKR